MGIVSESQSQSTPKVLWWLEGLKISDSFLFTKWSGGNTELYVPLAAICTGRSGWDAEQLDKGISQDRSDFSWSAYAAAAAAPLQCWKSCDV